MKHLALILTILSISLFSLKGRTQAHTLVFGLQYKPIIPTNIFGAGRLDIKSDSSSFNVQTNQLYGNVVGGVVRVGFTRHLSLETGISYVMRSYKTRFNLPDSNISLVNDFKVVSYQIPISLLVYIKLSDMFHMNVAIGSSLALFPTDIATQTTSDDYPNTAFIVKGRRKGLVQGTFDANVGFELRTKKIGYFYLGASYQLPYTEIMNMAFEYEYNGVTRDALYTAFNGSYLTADIRYFFPENPAKKKKWEEQKDKYNREQQKRKQMRKAQREARKKRKAMNAQ